MSLSKIIRHAAILVVSAGATVLVLSQVTQRMQSNPASVSLTQTPVITFIPNRETATPDDTALLRRSIVQSDASASESAAKPREAYFTYIVREGDTVWGIAGAFGLRPETILWSNYKLLKDNPDALRVDAELTIPPADGLIVDVEAGDTIDTIARRFKVAPEVLVQDELNALSSLNQLLPVGQTLFVRGGQRELVVWQLPEPVQVGVKQVQTKRGVVQARVYRVGACGNVAIPALGTGSLVYPTGSSFRSGYNFSGYHSGIDFGGKLGSPIYAADSGTVIFAGESANQLGQLVGYGRYVVLDHGNGYQTLYAHNTSLTVLCGQQVSKGEVIAYMGSTGNSTGPHSHFEVRLNNGYVNPWNLFQ